MSDSTTLSVMLV